MQVSTVQWVMLGTLLLSVVVSPRETRAQDQLEPAFPALTFANPVDLQNAGDSSDRLFVVEQNAARIRVFSNDEAAATAGVFLDLSGVVDASGSEMGLLGLAFHPDYATNGYFFVNYTAGNPRRTVVARYKVDADDPAVADPDSALILLEVPQPGTNHNAGQLAFGGDGYLYIAFGDGGQTPALSQDPTDPLGSLFRIDVDASSESERYRIPGDNPFVGNVDGIAEETWAYGFRNPWRFSFDESGRLWLADVGDVTWEEVNIIEKGGNYGWPVMEGMHCRPPATTCDETGLTLPIAEYHHSVGRSITGGYVYSGTRRPDLVGRYLYADYIDGTVFTVEDVSGSFVSGILFDTDMRISTFGRDESGEIYIVSYAGTIHRFKATSTGRDQIAASDTRIGQPFPNPADGWIVVPTATSDPIDLEVQAFDLLGRRVGREWVISGHPAGAPVELDVTDLRADGVYLLRFDIDGSTTWRQIFVARGR